ncbi:hypothetical protein OG562_20615 [Streptomyces sp. NBC_01275]|uniref:hypothetical protein n=1 Tax=Streptomyces sp. NBC_01275 TaxID=2903807 RepID=UPI0022541B4C|nr:hypothetical protein [Streptomyces sp. NBC_01275]MCX4763329.1 hypothetical protein [Streptomyces sp. NBC_01275]
MRIVELWLAQERPAVDGLFRADGSARVVEVDGPELSWFDVAEPFDLDALLADDPECLTRADIHPQGLAELPDGSGYMCCGDGSLGSEGFFARLDQDENLVWVVSLLESNPFERAEVHGSLATFTNNLGNSLTIDLTNPDFA